MPLDPKVAEAVSNNDPEYSVLSPTYFNLTHSELEALSKALRENTVVQSLYLDGNSLGCKTLATFEKFLCKSQIEVFSVSECELKDECISVLLSMLTHNKSLRELHLDHNSITDAALEKLIDVLPDTKLESISAEGNDATSGVLARIQKALPDSGDVAKDPKTAIARLQDRIQRLEEQLRAEHQLRRTAVAPPMYRVIHPGEVNILEKIGSGAFAKVYRGVWLGKEVAIKKLRDTLRASAVESLKREISLMAQLRHPNIVMLLGVYQDPDKPSRIAIVSEFMHHGCLFDLLEQCRQSNSSVDPAQMVAISRDIALGVLYLHSLKPPIIHRDLKSLNILLDENAIAKVCDFGLSRQQAEGGNTMTRGVGTPHWVAPEILRSGKYSEKVDVYSYGVLLWELLTCQIPYEGVDTSTLVRNLTEDPNYRLTIPDDIDPRWAKLVTRCFHNDPAQRPSMKEVVEYIDTSFTDV